MAESGRTGAASTSAVGSDAVDTNVVDTNLVQGTAVQGTAVDGNAGTGRAADSVTVVLRGADTARVRMPTRAERDSLGLDPDVPVWVIRRADGGTELYPGDSTVVAPAG